MWVVLDSGKRGAALGIHGVHGGQAWCRPWHPRRPDSVHTAWYSPHSDGPASVPRSGARCLRMHALALVIPLATPRQGSPLRLPHPRVRQRRLPQLAPPSDFDLVLKAVPRSAISHLKATFRSPVATFRSPVGNTAPHRGTVGSTEPRSARYHVCGWWTRGRERSTSSKAT